MRERKYETQIETSCNLSRCDDFVNSVFTSHDESVSRAIWDTATYSYGHIQHNNFFLYYFGHDGIFSALLDSRGMTMYTLEDLYRTAKLLGAQVSVDRAGDGKGKISISMYGREVEYPFRRETEFKAIASAVWKLSALYMEHEAIADAARGKRAAFDF